MYPTSSNLPISNNILLHSPYVCFLFATVTCLPIGNFSIQTNSNHQWMEGGLFCVLLRFPSWVPRVLGSYFRGLRVAVISYNVGGCSPLIIIISLNNNGLDLAWRDPCRLDFSHQVHCSRWPPGSPRSHAGQLSTEGSEDGQEIPLSIWWGAGHSVNQGWPLFSMLCKTYGEVPPGHTVWQGFPLGLLAYCVRFMVRM